MHRTQSDLILGDIDERRSLHYARLMFVVPGVPLIPQSKTWACWYASAEMLIRWKRKTTRSTLADNPSPSQVPELVQIHRANNGLKYSQVVHLAQLLGFRTIAPMSATIGQIETWIRMFGPLWVHGAAHIVVFAGADYTRDRVFVHNPWPPNVGAKGWKSYSKWFIHGTDNARRGTSDGLQTSFIYHP